MYLPLDPLFVKGEGADCLAREADVVEFLHDGGHGFVSQAVSGCICV